MKNILLLFTVLFTSNTIFAQANIAEARTFAQGQAVTVTGVVTNGSSIGTIRYLQDETAGLPVFDFDFTDDWMQGEEITVSGVMGEFRTLIQVTDVTSATVNSSGNPLPTPHIVTPNGINGDIEAQLATVQGVTFADAGGIFGVGTHEFTDANGESNLIFVRSNHPLVGTIIPIGAVNMTGIVSVFDDVFQLLPRGLDDIESAGTFTITSLPEQSDITQNGFTLTWETSTAVDHTIRYGLTPDLELGEIAVANAAVGTHTFTGFDAATFYYAQVIAGSGSDALETPVRVYSTASTSSGAIDVYFNGCINNTVSSGTTANGISGSELLQFFKDRIDAAQTSIDVAMFNNNRQDITAALTAAHERGVQVRYVTDLDEFNSGTSNPAPPFPLFKVQPDNDFSRLMHNKFVVIDVDSPQDARIITGSTNWTDNNIGGDFNNIVTIQDQALARAYQLEFEEMWGDTGALPGVFGSVAGDQKADNTPHLFNIGGTMVELYFSPSDNVSFRMEEAVRSADSMIDFALLTFTFNDLGTAILDKHNDGIPVRGIIENSGDTGTEFTFLQNNGVNVVADPVEGAVHHKYCVVDANAPNSDPLVITGSHNWSASAEVRNDENTLIIHSETIANQFWQEFEARWVECLLIGIDAVAAIEGFEVKAFPNPAVDYVNFDLSLENANDILIEIYDVNGKVVDVANLQNISGNYIHQMTVNHLAAGSYFATFTIDGLTVSRKFVK